MEITATGSLGFIAEPARVNTCLSRAKSGLVLVANVAALRQIKGFEGKHIGKVITNLRERGMGLKLVEEHLRPIEETFTPLCPANEERDLVLMSRSRTSSAPRLTSRVLSTRTRAVSTRTQATEHEDQTTEHEDQATEHDEERTEHGEQCTDEYRAQLQSTPWHRRLLLLADFGIRLLSRSSDCQYKRHLIGDVPAPRMLKLSSMDIMPVYIFPVETQILFATAVRPVYLIHETVLRDA